MDCENTYCIYQSEGECLLDHISIDSLGVCTEYIRVSLTHSELETLKRKQLISLDDTEK